VSSAFAPSVLLAALALGSLSPGRALAQNAETATAPQSPATALLAVEVVVVCDGDDANAPAIDEALARSLRQVGGFTRVVVSALSLSELRLAVGCVGEGAVCLERLARTLGASALVVRRLRTGAAGTTLSLIYRDRASDDAPLTASRTDAPEHLASQANALVRALYGVEEPAPRPRSGVRLVSWLTLGSGAALLLGGALLAASSSWGEHTTLAADTLSELERIESSYAAARTRALLGNILLGTGALVLGVGGALLAVDLLQRNPTPGADHLDLALSPSLHGVMLMLRHTSRSFL
jgi:hypothetical protein